SMASIHFKKISWDSPEIFNKNFLSLKNPLPQGNGRSLSFSFLQNFLQESFPEEFTKTGLGNSDSLRENFLKLSPLQKKIIIEKFGEQNLLQIFSLSLENHPRQFLERTYHFAQ